MKNITVTDFNKKSLVVEIIDIGKEDAYYKYKKKIIGSKGFFEKTHKCPYNFYSGHFYPFDPIKHPNYKNRYFNPSMYFLRVKVNYLE